MLCDLVRDNDGDEQAFHCAAFRPTLSVIHHDHTEAAHTEEVPEKTVSMSPKDKWFRAYAVQHLGINPDLISFSLRYHVVLSTRQRVNVFSSQHGEQIADMVRQSALPFKQTKVYVLYLSSDHLHLYIDSSPDYSLDEIVHAIREHLEQVIARLLPELKHGTQSLLERAYFAEGIG